MVHSGDGFDSPYRGLNAFAEQDETFFFGRDCAAEDLLGRMSAQLRGPGPLVVSGASGVGKSSLLRAGALSRIRQRGLPGVPDAASWPCLFVTPTQTPLDELALRTAPLAEAAFPEMQSALHADPGDFGAIIRDAVGTGESGSAASLILVVDQFERLLTHCADEAERRAFIRALHSATRGESMPGQRPAALVVLGVRADFEAQCARYPELTDAVQHRYLVTPMTDQQLRIAIVRPALMAGSTVQDELVDIVLADVSAHEAAAGTGALPLLSYALDQAWRSRAGTVLACADYENVGGIEGAIATSAQRVYDRLTPAQQAAARRVFLRLTVTSVDGVVTAERVTRKDVTEGGSDADAANANAVIEAFATAGLLLLDDDSVEICHEALLTAWPVLRDTWLADAHADRIVRTRLRTVAAEWKRHNRDSSYLYGGSLLHTARAAVHRADADPVRHTRPSQDEREFCRASVRRRVTRIAAGTALLTAAVSVISGTTAVAFSASRRAARLHNVAIAAASRRLDNKSEALASADPAVSRLLSVAAWRNKPTSAAWYAMQAALVRPEVAVLSRHIGPVRTLAFDRDGSLLATGSGRVRLWDVATTKQINPNLNTGTSPVFAVAFGQSDRLASGSGTGVMRQWQRVHGSYRRFDRPLSDGDRHPVLAAAYSKTGNFLASGSADGAVRVWRGSQLVVQPLPGHAGRVVSIALSPNGGYVAAGTNSGAVRVWEVANGHAAGTAALDQHYGPVLATTFSPDGHVLLAASGGSDKGVVRRLNLRTGQVSYVTLNSHVSTILSMAFSPDGQFLATGSRDGVIQLWSLATGIQAGPSLDEHGAPVLSLAFSPSGTTLASGTSRGAVRLWNVAIGRQTGFLPDSHGNVSAVAFSPQGTTVATGSTDGTVQVWTAAGHRRVGVPLRVGTGPVWTVAFSQNGKILAAAGSGMVHLWGVAHHRLRNAFRTAGAGRVWSMAFSPDRKVLAVGGSNGVRLWNVASHREIGGRLNARASPVWSLAFSDNGKLLATGGTGVVRLWDVAAHRLARLFSLQVGPIFSLARNPDGARLAPIRSVGPVWSLAFSPSGKILAIGTDDGAAMLWNVISGRQSGPQLNGGIGPVWSVVFSPDGKTLVTGSNSGTAKLWDVATREQIGAALNDGDGPVWSVAISANGATLATGTHDAARLWNVEFLRHVVPSVCASLRRSVTAGQAARYLPAGLPYADVCPGRSVNG